MIHSRSEKPRVFPWNNAVAPGQIDRCQDIGGNLSLNIEQEYEIGRDGKLGNKKNTPSFSYTMRQFEYGSMNFWRKLANLEDPASGALDNSVNLDDLKTPKIDISAYLTDDDATFRGTIWFPKLRVNGFSMNIGDPDAIVERNFDLVGEDYKILDANYFNYATSTVSGTGAKTVDLTSYPPTEYASGDYIFRVLRVRGGVVSELVEDAGAGANTWAYSNATKLVTVQTCANTDILKVYYPGATAYTTLWTNNDVDPDFLTADSCDVYMKVGVSTQIYRLQKVGMDVKFDRADYKEIGNSEVVLTGVKKKTVTVSLDKYSEDFSLEDILAGDTTYPYINPRDFSETIQLMVKIYSDKNKTVFKMGYLITGLTPTKMDNTQAVEDYNKGTIDLESENLLISDDENEIIFT